MIYHVYSDDVTRTAKVHHRDCHKVRHRKKYMKADNRWHKRAYPDIESALRAGLVEKVIVSWTCDQCLGGRNLIAVSRRRVIISE